MNHADVRRAESIQGTKKESIMSELNSGVRTVETLRTTITDIAALGEELSEEHLRLVAGGARCAHTYYGNFDGPVSGISEDWE
jgi:hypothetical protein